MIAYLAALKLKAQTALAPRSLDDTPDAEQGSGLVEMALILALVVVVAITALQALGVDIVAKLMEVANALS
jgi:Flp pilus assembly pilin Flp